MGKFINFKLQDGSFHPKTFNFNSIYTIGQSEKFSTLEFNNGKKITVIESKDEIIKLLNTTETEITLTIHVDDIDIDVSFI